MATWIQIAVGGYWDLDRYSPVYTNSPVFYEPGFNIMSPVEFVFPKVDDVFILVRKVIDRFDEYIGEVLYENYLDMLDGSPFVVSVNDVTTNTSVPCYLEPNNYNLGWNDSSADSYPCVLKIPTLTGTTRGYRFRALDISIRDTRDEKFVKFRLTVNDASQPFGYLTIDKLKKEKRPFYASFGGIGLLPLSYGGTYTILVPTAGFSETRKELATFSYPVDEIYYAAEDVINREPVTFSLGRISHEQIRDYVKVLHIPQLPYGAVVETDAMLRNNISDLSESAWFEINALSELSGSIDTVKFFLVRATGLEYV
jgi:hypothetical protein